MIFNIVVVVMIYFNFYFLSCVVVFGVFYIFDDVVLLELISFFEEFNKFFYFGIVVEGYLIFY